MLRAMATPSASFQRPGQRPGPGWVWQVIGATALTVACLVFYFNFHRQAFPEHHITFGVTRDAAPGLAESFIRQTGGDVNGYMSATVWRTDDNAKTYLEKELGVEATAQLADAVALWGFGTRYFRPLQKEEFRVGISPDGKIDSYAHVVDETAPGARLARADALAAAEAARRDLARLPGDWRLVEGTSTERPARLDWRFIWERADEALRTGPVRLPEDAQVRFSVVLYGDQVGEFRRALKVPEQWQRDYQALRSANNLVLVIDTGLVFVPLFVVALVVVVRGFARRSLRLRTPAVLGVIGAVLVFINSLNELPISIASYDTLTAWDAFLVQQLISALASGVPQAASIGIFAVAGDALYRRRFPDHLGLAGLFTWRGVATKPGVVALGVGVVGAAVVVAYQLLYYIVGTRIGFWVPAETDYGDLYSVFAPWVLVPSIGYLAASFEESAFRLFAICLFTGVFLRVFRGRPRAALWSAIVLSAAAWGFLHASYPQDPFYARGLELTIAGIFWGWLMVRYGILTSMAAHYTFNAFQGASALQQAGSLPTTVLSYAFTALPLCVAAISVVRAARRGGFEPAEPLLNWADQEEQEEPAPSAPVVRGQWRYVPLSARLRRGLLVVGVVEGAALIALALGTPPTHPMRYAREGALARADSTMEQAGLPTQDYLRTAAVETGPRAGGPPADDDLAREYLRDEVGEDEAREVFGQFIPTALWQVRYARPQQRDEYRVELLPDAPPQGRPFSMTYNLAETTPGARLADGDARRLAEAYIVQQPGWSADALSLVNQAQVERPNRVDHRFVFERTDVRYGEATLRAQLDVIGDRVSGYRPFVKIPEQWERERSAVDLKHVAASAIGLIYGLGLICLNVLGFLALTRARVLPARVPIKVGAAFALIGLIEEINNVPSFFAAYPTATPLETFVVVQVTQKVVLLGLIGVLAGLLAAALLGVWRARVAPSIIPTTGRRGWVVDATLVALVVALAARVVTASIAALGFADSDGARESAQSLIPAVAELAHGRLPVLAIMAALVTYLHLRLLIRSERRLILAALPLALVPALTTFNPKDGLATVVWIVVGVALAAMVARRMMRSNLAAYLGAAIAFAVLGGGFGLLRTANLWLMGNGVVILLVGAAGVAVFMAWERRQPPDPMADPLAPDDIAPAGLVASPDGR